MTLNEVATAQLWIKPLRRRWIFKDTKEIRKHYYTYKFCFIQAELLVFTQYTSLGWIFTWLSWRSSKSHLMSNPRPHILTLMFACRDTKLCPENKSDSRVIDFSCPKNTAITFLHLPTLASAVQRQTKEAIFIHQTCLFTFGVSGTLCTLLLFLAELFL